MDVDYTDNDKYECKNLRSHSQEHGSIERMVNGETKCGAPIGNEEFIGYSKTNINNGKQHLIESDIIELEFDTHEEAPQWYSRFAKCVRF